MKIVDDYIHDFIQETSLAIELEGKHEVRKYAKYWAKDIYSFAFRIKWRFLIKDNDDLQISHEYNPGGSTLIENIADMIYSRLKDYKPFQYYYDVYHDHLWQLMQSVGLYPETFFEEIPGNYDNNKEDAYALYGVREVLPLPITAYPVFSYASEGFTPDLIEYEGLKRAANEMQKVLPLMYSDVSAQNYRSKLYEVLSMFSIPLHKNVTVRILEGHRESKIYIRLYLNGIQENRHVKKPVYGALFNFMATGVSLIDTLAQFFALAIEEVIGVPKSKGSEETAVYGKYPMKDSSLHGLKLDFPCHMKDRMIQLFEIYSLNVIKESLFLPGRPVVSTSYGIDSVLVNMLVNKVYGSKIDIYHGKTGLNYREIYSDVENVLIEKNIIDKSRLFYGKNKVTYWDLVDEYGFNFDRKGKRTVSASGRKASNSEICCKHLKHIPFQESVKEHNWNIDFSGLRADESRARDLAAKRDGPLYYAKTWDLYRVNPILPWTREMVWEYTYRENIPYARIYDKELKDEDGKVIYKPRVGCWACMLTAKYGYLKWLKGYNEKLYRFIMKDKGLLKQLYEKKFGHHAASWGNTVENFDDIDFEQLLSFLDQRPCFFDDTLEEM